MDDGIIELDCEFAKEIGFTSDNFQGFLWKVSGYIHILFIRSLNPGQGGLSGLFNAIQEQGFGIKVPSPLPLMESICKQKGFTRTIERDDIHNVGDAEVWVLEQLKARKIFPV